MGAGEVATGLVGLDAGAEEELGAVDVADAADDVLPHQELADGGLRGGDGVPGAAGSGAGSERVGADGGDGDGFLDGVLEAAIRWGR